MNGFGRPVRHSTMMSGSWGLHLLAALLGVQACWYLLPPIPSPGLSLGASHTDVQFFICTLVFAPKNWGGRRQASCLVDALILSAQHSIWMLSGYLQ